MVIEALRQALGDDAVITDAGKLSNFSFDWTGEWSSQPLAVVQPTTADEVAAALKVCAEHQIPVVTQGGNSGLVGGSVGDSNPHIIVSTKKLRTTPRFDEEKQQLTLGAGYTLQEVQDIAQSYGLVYPVDTPSRAIATIGGNVATNAGGVRVIAFGMTEKHVVGLKLVLSDGTIVDRLQRLKKENTGFDISKLAIGSEGTLGIITDVCVQLSPARNVAWTALVPCDSIAHALEIALPLQNRVLAAEVFSAQAAQQVAENEGMKPLPNAAQWWLLLEGDAERPAFTSTTLWAMNPAEAAKFWNYRDLQAAMINRMSKVVKIDTSVSPTQLPEFVEQISSALNVGDNLYIFGHVLDGNLHVAVADTDDFDATSSTVINIAVSLGGAISAEHGIGQAKNSYLHLVRNARELEMMQEVRQVFDRAGIMNPHVLRVK